MTPVPTTELRLQVAELERQLNARDEQIRQTLVAWEQGEDLTRRMQGLARFTGKTQRWRPDIIVDKIREWAEQYGDPPTAVEWNPAHAKTRGNDEAVKRFVSGDWPHTSTVQRHFDSWNAAIEEAGFEALHAEDGYAHRMQPQGAQSAKWPEWTGWKLAAVYRERKGMTQAQVAQKANLSVGWISNMETGRDTNVSIRALLAYTSAIGLPPLALIEG